MKVEVQLEQCVAVDEVADAALIANRVLGWNEPRCDTCGARRELARPEDESFEAVRAEASERIASAIDDMPRHRQNSSIWLVFVRAHPSDSSRGSVHLGLGRPTQ